jgi:tetratricopeptide (TPR) repeat protein
MKPFTLLLLASLLVINNLFAQEPQESPELKEASALMQSAAKLFKEKKYDEALIQTKKALEIREKLLPQSDPLIANCLVYLADIHLARNEFDAAKKVLERSLAIQIERSSPDDVNLTPTMDRLAQAYYGNREDRKAEDIIKRSLAAKEKALGAESVIVAEAYLTLGQFYRAKKVFERALANYRPLDLRKGFGNSEP